MPLVETAAQTPVRIARPTDENGRQTAFHAMTMVERRKGGAMSYADVNGLSLYYEEHGSGEPLVLLHGGIGAGEMFAALLPELAAQRRVITVDLQGHGHTADIDRPLRPESMADDIAALIEHLGLKQADVMGYSLGGLVALRTAIQHPQLVRRLVLVSIAFRRDGSHPEVVAAMDQMSPELAEMLKQSRSTSATRASLRGWRIGPC
jgi:pimeloyl-ACP methyl ester carboxylesterase